MYEHKKEVRSMWQDTQQRIMAHLQKMVLRNTLSKIEAIAGEIGMSEDEFHNKISMSPRTPITNAERIALEHIISKRDDAVYLHYLRETHLNDSISIKEEL